VCDSKSDPGVIVEIVTKILLDHKIVSNFAITNWSRAVEDAKGGLIDGLVGASKADAPELVFPELPLFHTASCFYVHPESTWTFKKLESLEQQKLGASKGYTYGEPADTYIGKYAKEKTKIELVSGDNPSLANIKKLLDKRVSVIIEDKNIMRRSLKMNPDLQGTPKIAGCVSSLDLSVGFSPKNISAKTYAKYISDAVKSKMKSSEIKKIIQKYDVLEEH
jgi:polar amino acid transport system substrate-binding protein